MNTQTKLTVQLITENGKWQYVGTAFRNKDGSINVYLNKDVSLTGSQKLHLRPAKAKVEAVAAE